MTTFASISAIVLREFRIANGCSMEVLADRLNIKQADWSAMEMGTRDVQFEIFVRASHQIGIKPSQIIHLSECYVEVLEALGWDILHSRIGKPAVDSLLESAKAFWTSPRGSGCLRDMPISQVPILYSNGTGQISPVFRYALDQSYRDEQNTPITLGLNFTPISLENDETLPTTMLPR